MKLLFALFFISTITTGPSFASASRRGNWCAEIFQKSERQLRSERAYANSKNSDLQFLKRNLNPENMSTLGYEVIDIKTIFSDELIQELITALPKIGAPTMNKGEFVAYNYYFAETAVAQMKSISEIPSKFREPIIALISEITSELNRLLSGREGTYKFLHAVIRNYSRDDLTGLDNFHRHQNGFVSVAIPLFGPGTVIATPDPSKPDSYKLIPTATNQASFLTGGQRYRLFGIPATLHGSPDPVPGQQRLVLFLDFDVEFNPN